MDGTGPSEETKFLRWNKKQEGKHREQKGKGGLVRDLLQDFTYTEGGSLIQRKPSPLRNTFIKTNDRDTYIVGSLKQE